jgi:hypothetical protein
MHYVLKMQKISLLPTHIKLISRSVFYVCSCIQTQVFKRLGMIKDNIQHTTYGLESMQKG